jgi:eukaryotic-like serine/threonine-protein kinase
MNNEQLLNGRYRLVSQHGSGGMSVIYQATDIALGRTVAVKILRPSLTNDNSFLVRFRQEARNVANLSHPNIVTVHDVGQDGNTYYMVMEFVDGPDLKKIIKSDGPLSVERTLNIAVQMCHGIGYAHRAGLVHADVKPQNILMAEGDRVKVTDFGIAQALALIKPQERQKIVWGSPHYFSPEQAQGEYPSPAADVYSIGIVIFEMLTGRLPFQGGDQQELAMAHIRDTPPRISELNPRVPTSLDQIVQRVLAKDPRQRFSKAEQLGRVLEAYRSQGHEDTAGMVSIPASVSERWQPSVEPAAVPQGHTQDEENAAPYATEPTLPPGASVPPVYAQPHQHPPGAYPQPNYVGSDSYPYMPPEPAIMRSTGYRSPEPNSLDIVTLILAVVALLAMIGVVVLWIFVWQAYS